MPDEKEADQAIELAGELVLEWCRRQAEEVAALYPLGPDGEGRTDPFTRGFALACEELQERLKARFSEILERVTDALGYPALPDPLPEPGQPELLLPEEPVE